MQGSAVVHGGERAGVGATRTPQLPTRAMSELADLLRAQRQVSVHDLLDSGLVRAPGGELLTTRAQESEVSQRAEHSG